MSIENISFKFLTNPHYTCYNNNIAIYLQVHPRHIILHCLDRKGSSNKFTLEDIENVDGQQGLFFSTFEG